MTLSPVHTIQRRNLSLGGKRVTKPETGPDPEKLNHLQDRIDAMKAARAPAPKKEEHYTMANMAWRMVVELVAGIGIGFGMGYGLDYLFGTKPIFLVLFIGFGLASVSY